MAQAWAEEGLRVLAVAKRELEPSVALNEDDVERELVLVGLVALHDPLRPTAAQAVADARGAGIDLKMLTGDHPVTARAIAASLGIDDGDVFARITPADKLHIVEELQASGEVVAVTGDGVNDAPALRRADVGIAMGRSGSEAAREASDVVLTNDELGTIVAAVREGRRIYANITKFVAFLLSANLGEVVLFAVAILAGLGAPMTVVQVLVINLLTDGLPAVALARDPALPGHERRGALTDRSSPLGAPVGGAGGCRRAHRPRRLRSVHDRKGGRRRYRTDDGLPDRGPRGARLRLQLPLGSHGPRGASPGIRISSEASPPPCVLLLLAVYLPVHGAFGTVPLGAVELITALGLALLPVTAVEVAKAVVRRSSARSDA